LDYFFALGAAEGSAFFAGSEDFFWSPSEEDAALLLSAGFRA
jgi:hypothetical protein